MDEEVMEHTRLYNLFQALGSQSSQGIYTNVDLPMPMRASLDRAGQQGHRYDMQ
jgi:hypothetical protein